MYNIALIVMGVVLTQFLLLEMIMSYKMNYKQINNHYAAVPTDVAIKFTENS